MRIKNLLSSVLIAIGISGCAQVAAAHEHLGVTVGVPGAVIHYDNGHRNWHEDHREYRHWVHGYYPYYSYPVNPYEYSYGWHWVQVTGTCYDSYSVPYTCVYYVREPN